MLENQILLNLPSDIKHLDEYVDEMIAQDKREQEHSMYEYSKFSEAKSDSNRIVSPLKGGFSDLLPPLSAEKLKHSQSPDSSSRSSKTSPNERPKEHTTAGKDKNKETHEKHKLGHKTFKEDKFSLKGNTAKKEKEGEKNDEILKKRPRVHDTMPKDKQKGFSLHSDSVIKPIAIELNTKVLKKEGSDSNKEIKRNKSSVSEEGSGLDDDRGYTIKKKVKGNNQDTVIPSLDAQKVGEVQTNDLSKTLSLLEFSNSNKNTHETLNFFLQKLDQP